MFNIDFGGDKKFKLYYNEYEEDRNFKHIDIEPSLLYGSTVLTVKSSSPNNLSCYDNDGQTALYNDTAIIYRLDGQLLPQYIDDSMASIPATENGLEYIPVDVDY